LITFDFNTLIFNLDIEPSYNQTRTYTPYNPNYVSTNQGYRIELGSHNPSYYQDSSYNNERIPHPSHYPSNSYNNERIPHPSHYPYQYNSYNQVHELDVNPQGISNSPDCASYNNQSNYYNSPQNNFSQYPEENNTNYFEPTRSEIENSGHYYHSNNNPNVQESDNYGAPTGFIGKLKSVKNKVADKATR
jgi:hypothetical protein